MCAFFIVVLAAVVVVVGVLKNNKNLPHEEIVAGVVGGLTFFYGCRKHRDVKKFPTMIEFYDNKNECFFEEKQSYKLPTGVVLGFGVVNGRRVCLSECLDEKSHQAEVLGRLEKLKGELRTGCLNNNLEEIQSAIESLLDCGDLLNDLISVKGRFGQYSYEKNGDDQSQSPLSAAKSYFSGVTSTGKTSKAIEILRRIDENLLTGKKGKIENELKSKIPENDLSDSLSKALGLFDVVEKFHTETGFAYLGLHPQTKLDSGSVCRLIGADVAKKKNDNGLVEVDPEIKSSGFSSYIAPEILVPKNMATEGSVVFEKVKGEKADVFSCGVLSIEMLLGKGITPMTILGYTDSARFGKAIKKGTGVEVAFIERKGEIPVGKLKEKLNEKIEERYSELSDNVKNKLKSLCYSLVRIEPEARITLAEAKGQIQGIQTAVAEAEAAAAKAAAEAEAAAAQAAEAEAAAAAKEAAAPVAAAPATAPAPAAGREHTSFLGRCCAHLFSRST